jgi:hypothetical protein
VGIRDASCAAPGKRRIVGRAARARTRPESRSRTAKRVVTVLQRQLSEERALPPCHARDTHGVCEAEVQCNSVYVPRARISPPMFRPIQCASSPRISSPSPHATNTGLCQTSSAPAHCCLACLYLSTWPTACYGFLAEQHLRHERARSSSIVRSLMLLLAVYRRPPLRYYAGPLTPDPTAICT